MLSKEFEEELKQLLNRHSVDDKASTPDFMLARMLTSHLEVYCKLMKSNIKWHAPSAIGEAGLYSVE